MAISNDKKERIAHAVIKVLFSRFSSFPEHSDNNRNAPFHTAFLNAFRTRQEGRVRNTPDFIGLSSWIYGPNTTLEQTFFETVAHILCEGEKRSFKNKQIYANQLNAISNIMIELKNGSEKPSLERENNIIQSTASGELQTVADFTADCFFETEKRVVAIELKSVRPNSGEMRGEKQKLLQSKAVLQNLYPGKQINYFFGFPFDPTSNTDTGYDKTRFLHYLIEAEKFCDEEELLIADELWSYLAEAENTMTDILQIINDIATPQFMDLFQYIQESKPENLTQYRPLFEQWHMYSELAIIDKLPYLLTSQQHQRVLRQQIFKTNGSYNVNRLRLL